MIPFNHFWDAYQKKVGIHKCEPKWSLLILDHDAIMLNLKKFIPAHRNKQFRPNPLTYLNQRMWENEIITNEEIDVYRPESIKVNAPQKTKDVGKEFDHNIYRQHVKEQLTNFFKHGTQVIDYGNIMHQKLTDLGILKLPDAIKEEIRKEVTLEHTRKRTRFEDELKGSLNADIKTKELSTFLAICRKEKRNILSELKTNTN